MRTLSILSFLFTASMLLAQQQPANTDTSAAILGVNADGSVAGTTPADTSATATLPAVPPTNLTPPGEAKSKNNGTGNFWNSTISLKLNDSKDGKTTNTHDAITTNPAELNPVYDDIAGNTASASFENRTNGPDVFVMGVNANASKIGPAYTEDELDKAAEEDDNDDSLTAQQRRDNKIDRKNSFSVSFPVDATVAVNANGGKPTIEKIGFAIYRKIHRDALSGELTRVYQWVDVHYDDFKGIGAGRSLGSFTLFRATVVPKFEIAKVNGIRYTVVMRINFTPVSLGFYQLPDALRTAFDGHDGRFYASTSGGMHIGLAISNKVLVEVGISGYLQKTTSEDLSKYMWVYVWDILSAKFCPYNKRTDSEVLGNKLCVFLGLSYTQAHVETSANRDNIDKGSWRANTGLEYHF